MVNVRFIRTLFLLGTGFVLGLFGVSAYTDTPLAHVLQPSQGPTEDAFASACTPDTKDDDIFFLSCGGIF